MKRTTLVLEEAILEGIREAAHRRGPDMSLVGDGWLNARQALEFLESLLAIDGLDPGRRMFAGVA